MLRLSQLNPGISAYEQVDGIHNFERTPLEPMGKHVSVLATNLQRHHQANIFIDPTTGASLEYRHLIKGPTKSIWNN